MPKLSKQTIELLIVGILLASASALILSNLGNIYLWQDEAQTALISKTILTHGIPLGYDGKNYFSQEFGAEYGRNYIYRWHPWFPFYLLAGFFAVFGTSTFVCRLPFALIGIATVILTYYFASSLWRNKRAGILSAAVLTVSVPFLILVRQCRYYSPDAFFSLLGLYGYHRLVQGKRRSGLLFVVAGILLFQTQYMHGAALLMAVVIHALLFQRKLLRRVLGLSAITAVVNAPWLIWFSTANRIMPIPGGLMTRVAILVSYMLYQLVNPIFPPLILILPVAFVVIKRIRHTGPALDYPWEGIVLLVIFTFCTIAVLSVSPISPFWRYLVSLVPVACILIGLMIESGMRIHPVVGLIAVGLLAWWWRMPDYLYEITHDYDGPIEGIVLYLNEHAHPNDLVAVTHEDMPIKWYTNLRVIGPGTGEDQSPALKADWIIRRRYYNDRRATMFNYLRDNLNWDYYDEIVLPYPDTLFQNREDPRLHLFRTAEDSDPVMIYHRIPQ